MEIRQLTDAAEKQAVTRLILEALPEWFGIPEAREEYVSESADKLFFAAMDGENPVGFLCLKETGRDTVELYVMGVLKARHRTGAGRALVQALIDKVGGRIFLEVRKSNTPARALYASLGFAECGTRKNYYESPREDSVLCCFDTAKHA